MVWGAAQAAPHTLVRQVVVSPSSGGVGTCIDWWGSRAFLRHS